VHVHRALLRALMHAFTDGEYAPSTAFFQVGPVIFALLLLQLPGGDEERSSWGPCAPLESGSIGNHSSPCRDHIIKYIYWDFAFPPRAFLSNLLYRTRCWSVLCAAQRLVSFFA